MTYRIYLTVPVLCAFAACGAGTSNRDTTVSRADSAASTRRDSTAGSMAAVTVALAGARPAESPTPAGRLQSTAPGLPANHMGRIPVLEYHLIGDHDALYSRTREHFRADLEDVYRRGYRPITISQMIDKDFSEVPDGMSPVVFVFDDASPEQFRYIDKNGTLEIDSTSAVGVWGDFARHHPGWKNRAVFCVLNGGAAGHNFFGDGPKFQGQTRAWRFPKVKWLAEQGFELCDHTLWHAKLSKYSDNVVQEQIARNAMGIDSAVPGYKIRTFALPYGLWPKNRELAWHGSWTDPKTHKEHPYQFDAVLEVSGGPARSPYDPKFDPHDITRVEAIGDDIRRTLNRLDETKTRFVK